MRVALVLLGSAALAWFTYWQLERLGSARPGPAAAGRALAWARWACCCSISPAPCRRSQVARPLVLLDGSLSMTRRRRRWREALDSARAWGEVRLFGDRAARPRFPASLRPFRSGPRSGAAAASATGASSS